MKTNLSGYLAVKTYLRSFPFGCNVSRWCDFFLGDNEFMTLKINIHFSNYRNYKERNQENCNSSDGAIHRIVSNIAILKAYRISIVIAIIPSQTKRYSALLLWRASSATRPAQRYQRHRVSNKESVGRRVTSVAFQGRPTLCIDHPARRFGIVSSLLSRRYVHCARHWLLSRHGFTKLPAGPHIHRFHAGVNIK